MKPEIFAIAACLLVLAIAASIWRLIRGPTAADRMATSAMFGTAGVGALVLMASATGIPAFVDVALVLVVLAAVTTFVFVTRGEAIR